MEIALNQTLAALFGAIIGGILSVLASWLAQRVHAKAQWLSQEINQRQLLYGEFIEGAVKCYADALQKEQPNSAMFAKLYGDMGRMRLHSSSAVVQEANHIVHEILDTFGDTNRSYLEIRDLLAHDSIDLFSRFGAACRAELLMLAPHRAVRTK